MPVTTITKGDISIKVEGDDADFVGNLVEKLASPNSEHVTSRKEKSGKKRILVAESKKEAAHFGAKDNDSFADFVALLRPGKSRAIVDELFRLPSGLNDVQLREAVKVSTNTELAGTLSGIAKNARKAGIPKKNRIIKIERVEGVDGSKYLYTLSKEARKGLEKHLKA